MQNRLNNISEIRKMIEKTEAKARELDESYKNRGVFKMTGKAPYQIPYYTDYYNNNDKDLIGKEFEGMKEELQERLQQSEIGPESCLTQLGDNQDKFKELQKNLQEQLQQSGIDPKSYLTQLKNINCITEKIKASSDLEVWKKWRTSDHYDVKNKKDYFEGDNAYLNNTFTGGALKFFIARSYDTNPLNLVNDSSSFGRTMIKRPVARIICTAIFLLIASPIIAVVAVALAIPAIVFGSIEQGLSRALNTRKKHVPNNTTPQTGETAFANEVVEAHNPRSSTSEKDPLGHDTPELKLENQDPKSDAIIQSIKSDAITYEEGRIPLEELKILRTIESANSKHENIMENIRACRGRAGETEFPTSKVDNTKQQMKGFTDAQNDQLTTIRDSPGPQTGPDSKEDNVAKLGPNNNRV